MLRDILTQKGLSHREAEVAELVTKGLSNKEVRSQRQPESSPLNLNEYF